MAELRKKKERKKVKISAKSDHDERSLDRGLKAEVNGVFLEVKRENGMDS